MKKPRILLLLSVALVAFSSLARAESFEGSTSGERNFRLAWRHLDLFVMGCLEPKSCELSPAERKLLEAILESLRQQREKTRLIFASESEAPGTFVVPSDPTPRTAKTGDFVGSPIYLNRDLIGRMSVPEAAGLFIRELGHHQGVEITGKPDPDRPLDHLASKIRASAESRSESRALTSLNQDQIRVSIYQHTRSLQEGQFSAFDPQAALLVFEDGTRLTTFSAVVDALKCPRLSSPMPAPFWITNPRWLADHRWVQDLRTELIALDADIDYLCSTKKGEIAHIQGTLRTQLSIQPTDADGADSKWWKSGAQARFAPQGSGLQVLNWHWVKSTDKNEPAPWVEIRNSVASPALITSGGTWEVELTIHVPETIPAPDSCSAFAGSEQFKAMEGFELRFPLKSCRISPLSSPGDYSVRVTHPFSETTQNRTYFLHHIQLSSASNPQGYELVPTFRTEIQVANTRQNDPMHLSSFCLRKDSRNECGKVLEQPMTEAPYQMRLRFGSEAPLAFILSTGVLTFQSGNWARVGSNWMKFAGLPTDKWTPVAHSTQTAPGAIEVLLDALSLPYADGQMHDPVDTNTITGIYAINEDLQDLWAPLPEGEYGIVFTQQQ